MITLDIRYLASIPDTLHDVLDHKSHAPFHFNDQIMQNVRSPRSPIPKLHGAARKCKDTNNCSNEDGNAHARYFFLNEYSK